MDGTGDALIDTVRMSRQKPFEASHRYWVATWSADENRQRFGRACGPYGHGHNYVASATLEGPVDPETGMVVNLVKLDAALAALTRHLDHHFLNDACADLLRGRQPSTEVLATVLWENLGPAFPPGSASGPKLVAARLAETDSLWADARMECLPMIQLTRTYTFSAAHQLARADWSDEQNRALYGKCANPLGHGHDYRLDVTVQGEPDPQTGMVIDLPRLDAAISEAILDPWDHRHFNQEIPPFDRVVPTSENVVREAWRLLAPRLGTHLVQLVLYETPRGAFTYRGPTPG